MPGSCHNSRCGPDLSYSPNIAYIMNISLASLFLLVLQELEFVDLSSNHGSYRFVVSRIHSRLFRTFQSTSVDCAFFVRWTWILFRWIVEMILLGYQTAFGSFGRQEDAPLHDTFLPDCDRPVVVQMSTGRQRPRFVSRLGLKFGAWLSISPFWFPFFHPSF